MKRLNRYQKNKSAASKQQGATLFTALVFLALMTIVSVSAAKISMLDVLISGNNQQKMELYQQTARAIDEHTSPAKLLTLITTEEAYENVKEPWLSTDGDESISNRAIEYQCGALSGLATSQGAGNSCHLFDFEVTTTKPNSSARDRHVRGAGKRYPSISRDNFNN